MDGRISLESKFYIINAKEPKQAEVAPAPYESKVKTIDHLNVLDGLIAQIESLANDPIGTNFINDISRDQSCRIFIDALDKFAVNLNTKLVTQFKVEPKQLEQSAEVQIIARTVKMLQDVEKNLRLPQDRYATSPHDILMSILNEYARDCSRIQTPNQANENDIVIRANSFFSRRLIEDKFRELAEIERLEKELSERQTKSGFKLINAETKQFSFANLYANTFVPYKSKLKAVKHLNMLDGLMAEIESIANNPSGNNLHNSLKVRAFVTALDDAAVDLNEKLVTQFNTNPDSLHQSAESQIIELTVNMLRSPSRVLSDYREACTVLQDDFDKYNIVTTASDFFKQQPNKVESNLSRISQQNKKKRQALKTKKNDIQNAFPEGFNGDSFNYSRVASNKVETLLKPLIDELRIFEPDNENKSDEKAIIESRRELRRYFRSLEIVLNSTLTECYLLELRNNSTDENIKVRTATCRCIIDETIKMLRCFKSEMITTWQVNCKELLEIEFSKPLDIVVRENSIEDPDLRSVVKADFLDAFERIYKQANAVITVYQRIEAAKHPTSYQRLKSFLGIVSVGLVTIFGFLVDLGMAVKSFYERNCKNIHGSVPNVSDENRPIESTETKLRKEMGAAHNDNNRTELPSNTKFSAPIEQTFSTPVSPGKATIQFGQFTPAPKLPDATPTQPEQASYSLEI